MNWWAIQTALVGWSELLADLSPKFLALDANTGRDLDGKPKVMRSGVVRLLDQATQRRNPDHLITVRELEGGRLLSAYAICVQGMGTGDLPRFLRQFWELRSRDQNWDYFQTTPRGPIFSGYTSLIHWKQGRGDLAQIGTAKKGLGVVGRLGVAISVNRNPTAAVFMGTRFDCTLGAVIPNEERHLDPMMAMLRDAGFPDRVRSIDQALSVTEASFLKVPFDLAHWQSVAAEQYPNGLPEPYSDDPTQWLFHGHPAHAEPGTELHVALARLAGYRWPAERDAEMWLSAEARGRIAEAATLPEADADGLLALVPVLGERPLADRLRAYCGAAWGEAWQAGTEAALIAVAYERAKDKPPKQLTLEAWLSTHAARQHAKLFHDRPFLWWISDGRADGFTVVAHYHHLTRANLERLAYTVLGDWITRLGDDPRAEAARVLQAKLVRILEGEKPYDIFVRWKPLERQPVGWEPDLDDGVRQNIRPFIMADVLGCSLEKILNSQLSCCRAVSCQAGVMLAK
jgi:hypothetical protein